MTSIVADPPAPQAKVAELKYVYRLDEPEAAEIAVTGGKASNAAKLQLGGIPVPPGFAISTRLSQEILDPIRVMIADQHATLDPHNKPLIAVRSERIQGWINELSIPAEAVAAIKAAHALFGADVELAYRSSALDEDGGESSFAGQHSSRLFVGINDIEEAIKDVIASLHGSRAIDYRAQREMDRVNGNMPLLAMKMVRSVVAGVMFTVNKTTGNTNEIVVEFVWGQGEGSVSGEVTPDRVIIDKSTGKVTSYQRQKQLRMIDRLELPAADGSRIGWVDVPPDQVDAPKLGEAELLELWKWALEIEKLYGGVPMDTEFAFERTEEGGLKYLCTQARAVTSVGTAGAAVKETAPLMLQGYPGSSGVVSGPAMVIGSPEELPTFVEGHVLVMHNTDVRAEPQIGMSLGVVTDVGGGAAHAVLATGERGLPSVVGTGNATKTIQTGQIITLHGAEGKVYAGEARATLDAYNEHKREVERRARSLRTLVEIAVNIGNPELAHTVAQLHADAVGLARGEFILTNHIKIHPQWFIEHGNPEMFIAALVSAVGRICTAFGKRPVLSRELDPRVDEFVGLVLGAEYLPHNPNPAIGSHGAGMAILEPKVFEMEMRAYVELAKRHSNFGFMSAFHRFPYEAEEIAYIAAKLGLDFKNPNFMAAMMWETAANGIDPDAFLQPAARVGYKYISIGGNDATQGVLEVDRGLSMIQGMFSQAHPIMLKYHGDAIAAGHKYGMKVGFCGDGINKEKILFRHLIESGIDSVSPAPEMVHQLRIDAAEIEARLLGVDLDEYQARFPELSRRLADQLGKKYPSRLVAAAH